MADIVVRLLFLSPTLAAFIFLEDRYKVIPMYSSSWSCRHYCQNHDIL